jgi:hypothetical protein
MARSWALLRASRDGTTLEYAPLAHAGQNDAGRPAALDGVRVARAIAGLPTL